MITTCEKCKTRFNVPDEKIKPGGSRYKCTKCGNIMLVKLSAAQLKQRAAERGRAIKKGGGDMIPAAAAAPRQSDLREAGPPESSPEPPPESSPELPPQPPPEIPRMYQAYSSPFAQEKKDDPRPFVERLPGAFGYPFHGNGIWMLVAGTPFFWLLLLMSKYFILGFLVGLFVVGFLIAFMMKIISYSADGEDEVPGWPEISDFWDAVLRPIGQMLGILFFSFAPALIYFYFVKSADIIFLSLCGMGLLYIPMALITVSMSGSLININPLVVISSIFKMPVDYMLACVALFIMVGIKFGTSFVTSLIPIAGSFVDTFLLLYFLMAEMRVLGLLYYTNRKRFGWYDAA